MDEIVFIVQDDPDGGFNARSLGMDSSIFTEGEDLAELKRNIMEALRCHFIDEAAIPRLIRLHYSKDEILAYAPAS